LCIHDARNFDEYTQVLAGDTTYKMAFLGGEEGVRKVTENKRAWLVDGGSTFILANIS
jgi:hypothetical protein